ncbi:phage Gp37/Gp68 family protein [Luteimonas sp. TWI662]|uniref:phage Gp37/Gp68 family protein n=1 Tax=Luteimonas sp. TWI662 TaxID=3136789 RepID=UPI0032096D15
MAETSAIEWCDSTFNPWIGCTRVSPACDHCYAAVSTPTRTMGIAWGAGQARRRTSPSNWRQPLTWNARHAVFFAEHGRRRRVFCASLADVFDNEVAPHWLADLLSLIALTPNLDWLLLTKRVGNVQRALRMAGAHMAATAATTPAHRLLADWLRGTPPANVWIGATICNQSEADRDIPKLLLVPAAVRFLSMEPLLGPVNLYGFVSANRRCINAAGVTDSLDWVIVGGESGPNARPMNPQWVRDVRDKCAAAGVPFLFKQWGEWVSVSEVGGEGPHHTFDDGRTVRRAGKKAAGRTLEGATHSAWPAENGRHA